MVRPDPALTKDDYDDPSNVEAAQLGADGAATGAFAMHPPVNGSQGIHLVWTRPLPDAETTAQN